MSAAGGAADVVPGAGAGDKGTSVVMPGLGTLSSLRRSAASRPVSPGTGNGAIVVWPAGATGAGRAVVSFAIVSFDARCGAVERTEPGPVALGFRGVFFAA